MLQTKHYNLTLPLEAELISEAKEQTLEPVFKERNVGGHFKLLRRVDGVVFCSFAFLIYITTPAL